MRDFKTLQVWEKSHTLTLAVYRATANFPQSEIYGLTSQIRRASASIPANLAEGCGRNGNAEFARFCYISMGSASELEYHLLLAHDLGFLSDPDYAGLQSSLSEVKRMLATFIKRLTIGH
ncbi:four helix bundle protein [Aggregatilinea lenta]|uniref:four helix bundle protein n=1 Tax=Aggregatilinea lenta TaxID=913108 RepID=UPI000E5B6452|nr:four helix bundle protein [Aggregatilinea lenta]